MGKSRRNWQRLQSEGRTPRSEALHLGITAVCPKFDGFDTFPPFRHSLKCKAINNTNHKVASLGGTNRHLALET